MPPPVTTVTLNAVDITGDVHAPLDTPTVRFGRGANFDGTAESPGYAVVSVLNNDRKYNPYNSGSSLAASLKFGKRVHISTVYSAVTYHPFDGYLDRIVQNPATGFAELHCIDLLGFARGRETSVAISDSRDLRTFRGVVLDDLGLAAGDRSMGTGTGEGAVPFTGATRDNAADVLNAINQASGSIHFVRGKTGSHEYVAIDRTQLQSTAVAETWSDADFTQPFAETLGGLDYTREGLINRQSVTALGRSASASAVLVSSTEQYTLSASETRVTWRNLPGEASSVSATATVETGVTVTYTYFPAAVKVTMANSAGAIRSVRDIIITGRLLVDAESATAEREDTASQTTYNGVSDGPAISSELIPSAPHAYGLADWFIYRYKDVRARPSVTMVNRLPSQLTRDIGDRVAITSTELSTSASEFWIRAFETVIGDSGAVWRTSYDLEAAPTLVNPVTFGGTADQGLGGTAVMAY